MAEFYDEDEIPEPIVTFSFDNPPLPVVTDEKIELQPEFVDEEEKLEDMSFMPDEETKFLIIDDKPEEPFTPLMMDIDDLIARELVLGFDEVRKDEKELKEFENLKKKQQLKIKQQQLENIRKAEEDPYHFVEESIKNIDNKLKLFTNKKRYKYLINEYNKTPEITGLPEKYHNLLQQKLSEYMIANNILDKKLIEEEIKFSREPSNVFTIIRDAVDDPSLIQNKKDYNKLVNTLKLVEKNIGDDVSFSKYMKELYQKKKDDELNAEEKFILNNVKRDGLTNFINKRLNVLEELFPEYTYPSAKSGSKRDIISDTIKSLRELEQKTGKQFNILLQGEKIKKADKIDQEKKINSIKEMNKKVKIHKTRPIFIFGNKKDISTHFNIGNSIQVCRFINNAIEFHILTKTLRESDLNVLSYLLSKGKGVLYSKNKKKLGNLTDDDSIQKLIKRNIDFEKDVNIFLAIPEKVGGGIGPIHNNHGLIDLLRNKLRKF